MQMQAQTQATFTRRMQTQARLNSFFQDGGQVTLRLLTFALAFALSPVHTCGANANARKNMCELAQCKRKRKCKCRCKEWKIFHSSRLHSHVRLHFRCLVPCVFPCICTCICVKRVNQALGPWKQFLH